MLRRDTTARADHYASPDQLCVGLFVHVDLPWFRHPFTLNSFRISSEDQIRELRALKKSRYRIEPALSESQESGTRTVAPAPMSPSPTANAATANAGAATAVATPIDVPANKPAAVQVARAMQLRDYRKAVVRTEKSFVKAVGIVRRLNRNLLAAPANTLDEMGALVEQMTTVFLTRPEATLQVMGETPGAEETYLHNLNVSVICMMLAKGLNLGQEEAAQLGAGALLHDVGALEIPGPVLRRPPEERSKSERDLHALHVELGVKLGQRLNLPPAMLQIIAQHHELADGTGYPRGLQLEQIAPLARVVSLVNFYDNLCNPPDIAHAMTPHEALSFIFARQKSKFDAHILQVMIRSLGVYPPGSIVKLSNDAVGMVVSVNQYKSLRPWVLVYDAAVPKQQAQILNLDMEKDLNISKAIRPALLPAPVHAYLSPRRKITYFFDGGPETGRGLE